MHAPIRKASPVPAVLGIIGGAMLAVGSLLTWATVTVNTETIVSRLADLLGISVDELAGQFQPPAFERSVTGTGAGIDGWICLLAGVVVVAAAIVVLARPGTRKAMGVVLLVTALAVGGLVLWNMTRVSTVAAEAEEVATSAAESNLGQLGVGGEIFDGVFDVSMGVGLIACGIGALLASVGGMTALVMAARPLRTAGSQAPPVP